MIKNYILRVNKIRINVTKEEFIELLQYFSKKYKTECTIHVKECEEIVYEIWSFPNKRELWVKCEDYEDLVKFAKEVRK